jgi:hypothetical protein
MPKIFAVGIFLVTTEVLGRAIRAIVVAELTRERLALCLLAKFGRWIRAAEQ